MNIFDLSDTSQLPQGQVPKHQTRQVSGVSVNNPTPEIKYEPTPGSIKTSGKEFIKDADWQKMLEGYELVSNNQFDQIPLGTHVRYLKMDGFRAKGGYVYKHIVGKEGARLGKKYIKLVQNYNRPPNKVNNISWIVGHSSIRFLWINPNTGDHAAQLQPPPIPPPMGVTALPPQTQDQSQGYQAQGYQAQGYQAQGYPAQRYPTVPQQVNVQFQPSPYYVDHTTPPLPEQQNNMPLIQFPPSFPATMSTYPPRETQQDLLSRDDMGSNSKQFLNDRIDSLEKNVEKLQGKLNKVMSVMMIMSKKMNL